MQWSIRMSVRLLWVGAVLAAGALFVATAGADADQIAYSCEYDICLIDPDNPGAHSNITETDPADGEERSPSWSPDGHWIAYIADYPGLYDAFVVDSTKSAAESEATNISESSEYNANFELPPVWSPDGSRVAYEESSFSATTGIDVFVSPFDGSSPQVPIGRTNGGELHPSWTPDGRVVFSRGGLIYAGTADGTGTPAQFGKASGLDPVVSPDGRYVAATKLSGNPYNIVIFNADGSGSREIVKHADIGPDLSWSPDSTRVTYVDDENPSLDQVWVEPADGSSPGNKVPMPPGWIVPHNPVFSPDGTRVAFDARHSGDEPEYEQVLVGPADGSAAAAPLTKSAQTNQEPAWKPGPGGPKSEPPPPGPGNETETRKPQKVRLAVLKRVYVINNFISPVSVDCHAKGGRPTGKIAEICSARGEATYQQTRTVARPWAKPKAKKVVIAKGSVKVPAGKKKPLKMKLTAAGKRLLKPGRTLKLKLTVRATRTGSKAQTIHKTIKVTAPAKKR